MLITVMSERRAARAPARSCRRCARVPAGRGDEPVRRHRHRADLRRGVRPGVPAAGRLPAADRRASDHRPHEPARATLDRAWVGQGGRARAPHPVARRPAGRLVGARRHRHVRGGHVARGAARLAVAASRRVGLDAALVALSGRIRLREGTTRTPRTSSPSCGERVRPPGGRWAATREKRPPRTGRRRPAEPGTPAPRRATRPTTRSARRRRKTTSRRALAQQPHFEQVSPEVGELDEDAVDEALRGRPRRDAGAARRPDRRHRSEAARAWPAASPAGCSSTSPAAVRPRPRGVGQLREQPLSARRRRPRHRRQPGRDRHREVARCSPSTPTSCGCVAWSKPGTALCLLVDRSGSMGGEPLATAAVAAAAVAWRAPDDYSVLAFGKDVVVAKCQDVPKSSERVVERRAGPAGLRHDRRRRRADGRGRSARRAAGPGARSRSCCRTAGPRSTATWSLLRSALDELVIIAPEGRRRRGPRARRAHRRPIHHGRRTVRAASALARVLDA